jgi:hypothetical protein
MPKRIRMRALWLVCECERVANMGASKVRGGTENEFVGERVLVHARGKQARCDVHCTAPVFEYSRVPCAVAVRH